MAIAPRPQPSRRRLPGGGRADLGPACALPDSSSGFRHWAVYDIPASVHEVSAGGGDAGGKKLPSGARTSANEASRHGFLGPAPPPDNSKSGAASCLNSSIPRSTRRCSAA